MLPPGVKLTDLWLLRRTHDEWGTEKSLPKRFQYGFTWSDCHLCPVRDIKGFALRVKLKTRGEMRWHRTYYLDFEDSQWKAVANFWFDNQQDLERIWASIKETS